MQKMKTKLVKTIKYSFSITSSDRKSIFAFVIFFALLAVFYFLCLRLGSIDAFDSLVWRLACSLSKEALPRLLLRSGSSVTLIMAVGFALRAFFLATEGGLSMANYMMDQPGSSGGSEASVNQQAPNPEPPEPDLSHPLLDDNTRRAELEERAGFHFLGLSESQKEKVLDAQITIERAIEKALLSDGYSRDELNAREKRNEIRG